MPVDDAELSNMLQSANDELVALNEKRRKVDNFIQRCTEITKIPSQADPTKMEVRNDRLLGVKLVAARRQAGYDKLLEDKVTLGL